jgi:hypothetical protein
VLAALAISRKIEYQTGISIKKFVRLIRLLQSAIVTIITKEVFDDPELSPEGGFVLNNLAS